MASIVKEVKSGAISFRTVAITQKAFQPEAEYLLSLEEGPRMLN